MKKLIYSDREVTAFDGPEIIVAYDEIFKSEEAVHDYEEKERELLEWAVECLRLMNAYECLRLKNM